MSPGGRKEVIEMEEITPSILSGLAALLRIIRRRG